MKKLLILTGVLGLVVVGLLVATVMSINPIIEKAVNTAGPELLQTEVHLTKADISFLSGEGKLTGLFVGSPKGFKAPQTMKLGVIAIKLDTSTITKDVIVIDSVLIDSPDLTYEKAGSLDNFTALLNNVKKQVDSATGGASSKGTDSGKEAPKDPASDGKSPKVIIRDLLIKGAKVNMALTALGGKGMTLDLSDIHLQNIGDSEGGVSPAKAMAVVIGELNKSITTAVSGALSNITKSISDGVKSVTDSLKSGDPTKVEDSVKGLKKLFE